MHTYQSFRNLGGPSARKLLTGITNTQLVKQTTIGKQVSDKMVLPVIKRMDKVMFGPVEDWEKKSILGSGGRQYTLEECSMQVNHSMFLDLQAVSRRT